MGLVDHHHGVLVDSRTELDLGCVVRIESVVGHELLVGDQLRRQHVLAHEGSPRAVPQGGRRDHQHPLAAVHGGLPDQLAREERLAEAHLVGDEDAVALGQDAPGPPQPVRLE